MDEATIVKGYQYAKDIYGRAGVDVDRAIELADRIPVFDAQLAGGRPDRLRRHRRADRAGIAATGNYPGRAATPDELRADIDEALRLIPGTHRINLHASYALTGGKHVPKSELLPEHFAGWVEFARQRGLGLDFNPTLFSDDMVVDNLTLSSPDGAVRRFWIDHCKACRRIGEYFGRELGTTCLVNIWIPDGFKDVPADRLGPRRRLKEALDEIYSEKLDPPVHCRLGRKQGVRHRRGELHGRFPRVLYELRGQERRALPAGQRPLPPHRDGLG